MSRISLPHMEKPRLLIDFYGTLSYDTFWRSLNKDAPDIQRFLFEKHGTLVSDWMLGKYNSEYINKFVSQELRLDYEALWNTFVTDCSTMRLVNGALDKIGVLRDRYECILLTDNMDCFQRFTVFGLGLNHHFDKIISSSETGAFKLETLPKLVLTGTVMIDDSEPACARTKELGGVGLHVTPIHDVNYYLESLT